MHRGALVTAFVVFQWWFLGCEAQKQDFQWTFGNNFVLTDIQECQQLLIVVSSLFTNNTKALGTPPYYMLAFENGGIPTTSMIGTDPTKLSWQANHARGATLMLTVVDSTGNTGGIPPNLYNVTAGSSTDCIPAKPPASLLATIKPNITDSLTTCQPWGLTISGGTKPYQVILSARNSPVITNVTMGADDDVFTFIDRADPNTLLMANVVDGTGQWGVSTSLIPTTGSIDYGCVGLVSTSKTTQEIQQEAIDRAAQAAADAKHRRNMRIIAIVLGISVPIFLLVAGVAFWRFRQQRMLLDHNRGVWDGQDVTARVWENPPTGGEMVQLGTPGTEAHHHLLDHKRSLSNPVPNVPDSPPGGPVRTLSFAASPTYADYGEQSGWFDPSRTNSSSRTDATSRPGISPTTPTNSGALTPRQRKALEAQASSSRTSSSSQLNALPPGAQPPHRPGGARSPRRATVDPSHSLDHDTEPDIIIQHRDAGAGPVVQELPPPYMNRLAGSSNGAPAPSQSRQVS
ncbi:hypothetical protein BXZ70DRAFT_904557 [Cristinia sonorae]|uniref:Mid2 domain-containing protein n=1 Tax=Cristinia sonorae TaxID=1940300 RepID=A0A8K0UW92_9AGAR|nr:hypothetical protein BXZ70DRAFT_904557 [Cristinia sonorae]